MWIIVCFSIRAQFFSASFIFALGAIEFGFGCVLCAVVYMHTVEHQCWYFSNWILDVLLIFLFLFWEEIKKTNSWIQLVYLHVITINLRLFYSHLETHALIYVLTVILWCLLIYFLLLCRAQCIVRIEFINLYERHQSSSVCNTRALGTQCIIFFSRSKIRIFSNDLLQIKWEYFLGKRIDLVCVIERHIHLICDVERLARKCHWTIYHKIECGSKQCTQHKTRRQTVWESDRKT